jgi:thiamine-phosphate pyrophosphorylase
LNVSRLYLITPPRIDDPAAFAKVLAECLEAGDVACVQLMLKGLSDDELCRKVDILRPPVQRCGVAFLLNDRADLAFETGCDGVHIGQQDASYKDARAAIGADAIVGVTCHNSRHLAMEAADAGADYVAFGAFYPTATKEAPTRADPDLLAWWSELMTVPCVAIGGITITNAPPLVQAGADFVAVSSGVWDHPRGPAEAVREFNQLFSPQMDTDE